MEKSIIVWKLQVAEEMCIYTVQESAHDTSLRLRGTSEQLWIDATQFPPAWRNRG